MKKVLEKWNNIVMISFFLVLLWKILVCLIEVGIESFLDFFVSVYLFVVCSVGLMEIVLVFKYIF